MSNSQTFIKWLSSAPKRNIRKGPVTNLRFGNVEMTNLCTDEIVFFRNLTKIDTDENKEIYSM